MMRDCRRAPTVQFEKADIEVLRREALRTVWRSLAGWRHE